MCFAAVKAVKLLFRNVENEGGEIYIHELPEQRTREEKGKTVFIRFSRCTMHYNICRGIEKAILLRKDFKTSYLSFKR